MEFELQEFAKTAMNEFDACLASHGFVMVVKAIDKQLFRADYAFGQLYVSLVASRHPRDYPPYFNVVLGEGSLDWPERDWNSVALWRLANYVEHNDEGSEFSLVQLDDTRALVSSARASLERYHCGFLDGDTQVFRRIRAEQTRQREPYKIHEPDGTGRYSMRYDPVSTDLKKTFSSE